MGANCTEPVGSVTEGIRVIEKAANFGGGLQPVGHAAIFNTRNHRAYYYELVDVSSKEFPIWKARRVKVQDNQVPRILPVISKIFGKKPTVQKPYIAMIRLD